MASVLKQTVLAELERRLGRARKLEQSQSLFDFGNNVLRVYSRYSRVHSDGRTFYGLREDDLRKLEGRPSLICFLWDSQQAPLFLPFQEFEETFRAVEPANDGQYKSQVFLRTEGTEFYLAKAGRFNVDAYVGWDVVDQFVDPTRTRAVPDLTHSQVQSFLGAIGMRKLFDIWVPRPDRTKVGQGIPEEMSYCHVLPTVPDPVGQILEEVDVIWIERGSGRLRALFEVEHSTTIYSGLLRFNDIHLVAPQFKPTYSIVADNERRSSFVRQLARPTFVVSGLNQICTFMEYENVFSWYERIVRSDHT